jgi:hypothetical protein
MTEAQIESLAAERVTSATTADGLDATYLRVLVAAAKSRRGKPLDCIERAAAGFYAAVLRGVSTPDIAIAPELEPSEIARRNRERHRRATWARSVKSTLTSWIRAGGELRELDVAQVTKSQLRAETLEHRDAPTTAERIEKAQAAILAAIARDGPRVGRGRLEAVIAALQAALNALPARANGHGRRLNAVLEHRAS